MDRTCKLHAMNEETSWAYLAGFTDGDGCISYETAKRRYHYARVRWAQKEATSQVLDWIATFLSAQGIKIGVRNFSVARKSQCYPQRELAITNVADSRIVIRRMLPYLVLKRGRALEALEILDEVHELKTLYGNKYRISTGKCRYDDCAERFYAKGLCKHHYDKERRGSLTTSSLSS